MSINWGKIERKWKRKWDDYHIYETDPKSSSQKYFITVAYPYPNSPQHIGHGRTYTLADVHARYNRMLHKNVLFPMAFHYTGTPILAMSKRLAEGDKELIETFTQIYHVSSDKIKDFHEPLVMARYFHEEIKKGMVDMGYSIDWRREFTTIDPQYNRFIEWQFEKLHEKSLIVQGHHPVGWCPIDESPVGQHDTLGDKEPEIGEFILIKFSINDYFLPAATLRSETIFGVTNLWLHPDALYVKIQINKEKWIVSKECLEKLSFLNYKVEKQAEIIGKELIGKWVKNPIIENEIPILPASFVDPNNATGVVMSVPAHAPYDFQALKDLGKNPQILRLYNIDPNLLDRIKPVSVIQIEGYSEFWSYDFISKMGIKSQDDPQLENATREVYNKELSIGRMRDNTLNYSGLSVSVARNKIKEELLKSGKGNLFYEILNRPLVCRCGTHCLVKILENQWFINYGDKKWKDLTSKCLNKMSIIPEDIRTEFKHTIGWLKQKACARKHGLGTKLPWDKEWIIESLSDSVIYMAYYTFSKFINQYNISSHQLNNEVFDYILLGNRDVDDVSKSTEIDVDLLQKMRKEFLYFYPLNTRHSGRDLVPNHLTFFIFNHVAIFPIELWPLQIVINGSVLMEGKKMSKSFGNIIPLREAIKTYSADALRLTILSTAELLQDVDFSKNLATSIKTRLENFYTFALEIIDRQNENIIELTNEDRWLLSRLHRTVEAATEAMNRLRIRECINLIFYELDRDFQWYLKRIYNKNSSKREDTISAVLYEMLDLRVRMLSPFAPFISEEIWEKMGKKGFVSLADWPKSEKSKINVVIEEAEEMIKNTLEDTLNIIKVTKKKPERICFYISSDWKWHVYNKALEVSRLHNFDIGTLIKEIMKSQRMRTKEVQEFIRKIYEEIRKLPNDMKMIRLRLDKSIILEFFLNSKSLFEKQTGAKVEIYQEDEPQAYDPNNRAHLSSPFRVGIYIE